MAAPSFQDLYDVGRVEALLRRPDLFINSGDITDFILAAAAAMGDKNIQYAAELFKNTFIDGATGSDLDTLLVDHIGLSRNVANAATASVDFSRPTDTAGSGTILAGTVITTSEDPLGNIISFTLDSNVNFGPTDLGPLPGAVTAVESGISSNVAVGELSNIVDSLFDSTITVTNPLVAGGGTEEETDAAYRERARNFYQNLQRGTLAALELAALGVAGVDSATATEDVTGLVTVFISDGSGGTSAQLIAEVTAELENFRCAGSSVQVTGANILLVAVTVNLTLKPGTSLASLDQNVQDAITDMMAQLGTGETLYDSKIVQVVMNVDSVNILDVDVIAPVGDFTPTTTQLIRAGTITVQ